MLRYVAIAAAAAFLALTTAASAQEGRVTEGPVKLSATELDSVTAGHANYHHHNKYYKLEHKKFKKPVKVEIVKEVIKKGRFKIINVYKVITKYVYHKPVVKKILIKVVKIHRFKHWRYVDKHHKPEHKKVVVHYKKPAA